MSDIRTKVKPDGVTHTDHHNVLADVVGVCADGLEQAVGRIDALADEQRQDGCDLAAVARESLQAEALMARLIERQARQIFELWVAVALLWAAVLLLWATR